MNIIQNQGKRRDLGKSKGIREETDGRYKIVLDYRCISRKIVLFQC